MIPPWQDALKHAMAQLAPRGELHIVDFGEFADYPALLRAAQLAWLRRFSVVPIPGMQGKIAALAEEAGLTGDGRSALWRLRYSDAAVPR